ncbi:MAG: hypothetical protein D4R81_00490 [Nitrospiraceae bacterium]|nr:MAG: hypothetical protein D4R81_00490 [Nitrospiraceae bacterium]
MKIQFERTGGVAGLRLIATVHSDALAPEEARKVQAMVQEARFFDLPSTLSHAQPGADRFQYTVTVEIKGRRHTVEIADGAAPPRLRPLLDWLTAKARQKP